MHFYLSKTHWAGSCHSWPGCLSSSSWDWVDHLVSSWARMACLCPYSSPCTHCFDWSLRTCLSETRPVVRIPRIPGHRPHLKALREVERGIFGLLFWRKFEPDLRSETGALWTSLWSDFGGLSDLPWGPHRWLFSDLFGLAKEVCARGVFGPALRDCAGAFLGLHRGHNRTCFQVWFGSVWRSETGRILGPGLRGFPTWERDCFRSA